MGTEGTIRLLAANAFVGRVGDQGLPTARIDALGPEGARRRIVVTTDPTRSLLRRVAVPRLIVPHL